MTRTLQIPLRARLATKANYPVRPKYRPSNGFLTDVPQPKLPKYLRK